MKKPEGGDPGMAASPTHDLVFFDGDCLLCQKSVLFLMRRDPGGVLFRYGSQGGETFAQTVPEASRAPGEGSLVVRTGTGELRIRSAAVIHLLRRLGGGWAVLGVILFLVPRPLRDWGYRVVARLRNRLFRSPGTAACGLIPASLRERFMP